MVPIALRLRNFLCYRENVPPLSFTGFRVACLSGSNGHGKSALLDAISWALWGQARSKSADDLIHHGQAEMEVDFEFAMGEEQYRVVRKYSRPKTRTGSGQTILELQIAHDDLFRPITGNTVRETEAKIVDLLRLDYETFINSSCLLQGRADEFTIKRPGERKRILAEILGLGYYDRLEELAKEAVREWVQRIQWLEADLAAIDREIAGRDEFVAAEGVVAAELERLELIQRTGTAELQAALEMRRLRDVERQRLAEAKKRLTSLNAELGRLTVEAERAEAKIADFEQVIGRAPAIEAAYRLLTELRDRAADLDVRLADHQARTTERQQQVHAIELARRDLEGQIRAGETAIARARALADRLPASVARQADLDRRAAELDLLAADLEKRTAELAALTERRQRHQMEKDRLRAEMDELKRRLDLLEAEGDGRCWLCGHELGVNGQQHLRDVCRQDGTDRAVRYRQHEAAIKELERQTKPLETAIERDRRQIGADQTAVQTERGRIAQQIAQAQEAAGEIERTTEAIDRHRATLAADDYAQPARARLAELDAAIAAIGYDAEAHQAVRARLAELGSAERDHWTLERARREVETERTALADRQAAIAERRRAIAAEEAAAAEIQAALAAYPDLDVTIGDHEAELRRINQSVAQTRERLGGLRQQIQAADAQAGRRPAVEQAIAAARLEKTVHDDLVLAFGRRGIQAMIIDAVLPELEEEANQLLARMTDNRMHLTFETQRESKRGSAIETLDIRVADELGTRPYELFSGGEAFRINFAVRIALSRLLARRAGARLQTLIIDEGFGTQDAAGREKLIDAINSVEPDFEKILVITHVDELKDLFTTRIDVVKDEHGSIAVVA